MLLIVPYVYFTFRPANFLEGSRDFLLIGLVFVSVLLHELGHLLLARLHGVPFYVAAPWSTVDLGCPSGLAIPIVERASDEVTRFGGKLVAPEGVRARHPAFDVTRAGYVTALFTERGIADPPGPDELERLARSPAPQA